MLDKVLFSFNEDEMPNNDNAYNRAIKLRKWLVLSSVFSIAVSFNILNLQNINSLVKIISITDLNISINSFVLLSYLLVQYLFLTVQLVISYKYIIENRFKNDISETINALRKTKSEITEKMNERSKMLQVFQRDHNKMLNDIPIYENELAKLYGKINQQSNSKLSVYDIDNLGNFEHQKRIEETKSELNTLNRNIPMIISQITQAKNEIDQYEIEISNLDNSITYNLKRDLSSNTLFKISEMCIDFKKIAVPLFIAIYSIFSLSKHIMTII